MKKLISSDYYPSTDKFFMTEKIKATDPTKRNLQDIKIIDEIETIDESQAIDDKYDMLDIMKILLKIKHCKKSTLYQILYGEKPKDDEKNEVDKQREHSINILKEFLLGIQIEHCPHSVLFLLYEVASLVPAISMRKKISKSDRNLFI